MKRVELGSAKDINEAVENWRKVAADPDQPRTDGREFLEKLKALVWDKLEPHLAGIETILYSPDGSLCRFPLVVLPGSRPDTYLMEERTIVVVPLARLLPQLMAVAQEQNEKPTTESMLLVGDVEYGGSPGQGDQVASRSAPREDSLHSFRKLDHSAAEVAAIQLAFQRHFKQAQVDMLLGEEATESAFRRQAPRHRWLHLATHGYYDPPSLRAQEATADANAPLREHSKMAPLDHVTSEFEHGGVVGYHPGLLSGLARSWGQQ